MSVTSGFFNSVNNDRRYNAEQMSSIFDGVIRDGIFMNIGTAFGVLAGTGTNITVGIGRAWFNSTWLLNDSILPIAGGNSEVLQDRIDAVIIEIDRSIGVRSGSIKLIKGVPSTTPQAPAMIHTEYLNQYPLAFIRRKAGSTSISQADITNKIGTSDCPYVTGILQVANIDNIVAQWQTEWVNWTTQQQIGFMEWMDSLQDSIDGNVAAKLAEQIYRINNVVEVNLFSDGWIGSSVPYWQAVSVPAANSGTEADLVSALKDGSTETVQKAYNKAFGIVTSGTGTFVDEGPNLLDSNVAWEAGQYTQTGEKGEWEKRIRVSELIKVVPSTLYVFKFISSVPNGNSFIVRAYDRNKMLVSSWGVLTNSSIIRATAANEHYLGITIEAENGLTAIQNGTLKPFMGISGGSAIFKVYKKPVTDVAVGLKGVGDRLFIELADNLLDSANSKVLDASSDSIYARVVFDIK